MPVSRTVDGSLMPDEFKLHQIAKRADEAKAILDSPLLAESLALMRGTYLGQLVETDVTQTALRDKCWMMVRCVDVFKDHLVNVLNKGVVAKSDLQRLAQEGERKKRFGIV